MGYKANYHGTYPSQWSEWDWNFEHQRYVRYRLVSKDDYEWDVYEEQPEPEPEFTEEYPYSIRYPEQYSDPMATSEYTCTTESTSDFNGTASQSDRDSGYYSSDTFSEGFEDLLDHPESWTENPFVTFGFPPAKDSKKHHHGQKQAKPRSRLGLNISLTSLHSDEGFSEPNESWITLFGNKNKEVNIIPSLDHQNSGVCYVSHSVLKDLGLWDSRRMGKGRAAWIVGSEEGEEERIKIVGSWCVSWLPTFKGNGRKSNKMQRTTFKVFKDKKRRVVLGMSPREARKLGIS